MWRSHYAIAAVGYVAMEDLEALGEIWRSGGMTWTSEDLGDLGR